MKIVKTEMLLELTETEIYLTEMIRLKTETKKVLTEMKICEGETVGQFFKMLKISFVKCFINRSPGT